MDSCDTNEDRVLSFRKFVTQSGGSWKAVGIFLSFYFKNFKVVVPTKNHLFYCYMLTYEFVYGDLNFPAAGDFRHHFGVLYKEITTQMSPLVHAEHTILMERTEIIHDFGKFLGLYSPPEVVVVIADTDLMEEPEVVVPLKRHSDVLENAVTDVTQIKR